MTSLNDSFFFNDPSTPEIYTLSLHDALPISLHRGDFHNGHECGAQARSRWHRTPSAGGRSEEHTSELQSRENLVCRLLLEKKNINMPAAIPGHPIICPIVLALVGPLIPPTAL